MFHCKTVTCLCDKILPSVKNTGAGFKSVRVKIINYFYVHLVIRTNLLRSVFVTKFYQRPSNHCLNDKQWCLQFHL